MITGFTEATTGSSYSGLSRKNRFARSDTPYGPLPGKVLISNGTPLPIGAGVRDT